jgi:hypothetical protein
MPEAVQQVKPLTGPQAPANPAFRAPTNNADQSKTTHSKVIVNAPFQIKPIGQRQQYLKLLIYGKHGSGKTTLAATSVDVASMRDVMHIDAESGDNAVQDSPYVHNADLISHVRVTSFKQVAYIHQFLQAHAVARDNNDILKLCELESRVTGVPADEISTPKRYYTAIIDSLSEVDQYSLYALRGVSQDQLLSDPGDIEKMEWKEYGKHNEMMKMLVRAYRDLPMNVIFCCSDQYNQNEMKKFHYAPAMTGKLSTQVQGMMDIVGFLVVSTASDEKTGALPRRMFIQPGEHGGARFDAKNRRAQFTQAFIDDPNMSSVMSLTGMIREGK